MNVGLESGDDGEAFRAAVEGEQIAIEPPKGLSIDYCSLGESRGMTRPIHRQTVCADSADCLPACLPGWLAGWLLACPAIWLLCASESIWPAMR